MRNQATGKRLGEAHNKVAGILGGFWSLGKWLTTDRCYVTHNHNNPEPQVWWPMSSSSLLIQLGSSSSSLKGFFSLLFIQKWQAWSAYGPKSPHRSWLSTAADGFSANRKSLPGSDPWTSCRFISLVTPSRVSSNINKAAAHHFTSYCKANNKSHRAWFTNKINYNL